MLQFKGNGDVHSSEAAKSAGLPTHPTEWVCCHDVGIPTPHIQSDSAICTLFRQDSFSLFSFKCIMFLHYGTVNIEAASSDTWSDNKHVVSVNLLRGGFQQIEWGKVSFQCSGKAGSRRMSCLWRDCIAPGLGLLPSVLKYQRGFFGMQREGAGD